MSPIIGINISESLPEDQFSDFFEVLNSHDVSYRLEKTKAAYYASLEWLIPTGVVLYITKSYFEAMLKEIGKEHYQWLKIALPSLYKKVLGSKPEVEYRLASPSGIKTPSYFSPTFSFVYVNQSGSRVKLLFPLDVTESDYTTSCLEFIKIIAIHEKGEQADALRSELEHQALIKSKEWHGRLPIGEILSSLTLLIFWDRNSNCFYVADPTASSKQKILVSRKIACTF